VLFEYYQILSTFVVNEAINDHKANRIQAFSKVTSSFFLATKVTSSLELIDAFHKYLHEPHPLPLESCIHPSI
jgi:hypothetical protein